MPCSSTPVAAVLLLLACSILAHAQQVQFPSFPSMPAFPSFPVSAASVGRGWVLQYHSTACLDEF